MNPQIFLRYMIKRLVVVTYDINWDGFAFQNFAVRPLLLNPFAKLSFVMLLTSVP